MLVADHDDAIAEFGHTAPQTRFIREVYAAAAVAAASEGTPVAALEPLFHGTSMEPGRTHELAALEDIFHEKFDGLLFSLPDDSLSTRRSALLPRSSRHPTSTWSARCLARSGTSLSNSSATSSGSSTLIARWPPTTLASNTSSQWSRCGPADASGPTPATPSS
jgi:hypothetical protein